MVDGNSPLNRLLETYSVPAEDAQELTMATLAGPPAETVEADIKNDDAVGGHKFLSRDESLCS